MREGEHEWEKRRGGEGIKMKGKRRRKEKKGMEGRK